MLPTSYFALINFAINNNMFNAYNNVMDKEHIIMYLIVIFHHQWVTLYYNPKNCLALKCVTHNFWLDIKSALYKKTLYHRAKKLFLNRNENSAANIF